MTHSYVAGLEATRYLISLGHTKIMHVAGPRSRNEGVERERGYGDAMRESGHVPNVAKSALDWSPSSGLAAAQACDPASFTAVFCANDEIALGFLHGMAERGYAAPRDFSIVGVDDMPTAAYFSPPLTTMRMDFVRLGAMAFAMVRDKIMTGVSRPHPLADPVLVIRESTAPVA
jgi:DNA-binding LacI/PurR family transcriptional regulator